MDEITEKNKKLQMIGEHINEDTYKKLLAAKAKIQKEVCILVEISKSKTQNGQRNILNKWFQDSIKNYFLEVFAAPLIIKDLGMTTIDQVKHYIHQSVVNNDAKFMLLLNKYYQELTRFGKELEFRKSLQDLVLSSLDEEQGPLDKSYFSYNRQKTIRKRFVGLLLLVFCSCMEHNKEITSFYDIWNETFPEDQKHKKKLSKYDTIRIKRANEDNYKHNQIIKNHSNSNNCCDSRIYNNTDNLAFSNQTDPVTDDSLKTNLSCLAETQAPANQGKISNRDQLRNVLPPLQPFSNVSHRVGITIKDNQSNQFTCSYRYLDSPSSYNIQPQNQEIHDTIKIPPKSAKSSNLFSEFNSIDESSLRTGLTFRSIIDIVACTQCSSEKESQQFQKFSTSTFKGKQFKIHKKPVRHEQRSYKKVKQDSQSSKVKKMHHFTDLQDQREQLSNDRIKSDEKQQQVICLKNDKEQKYQEEKNIGKSPVISLVDNYQLNQSIPGGEEFIKNQDQIGQQSICSDYTRREMVFSVSSTNSQNHPISMDNQLNGISNYNQVPELLSPQSLGFPENTIQQKYLQYQQQLTQQLPFYQSFGQFGQNIIMNLYQWQSVFHQ